MRDAIRLFSYGTLQQCAVQMSTFGRELHGTPDAVVGYCADQVRITDPLVIERSGSDCHPILRPSADGNARVPGTVFDVSDADLAAADEYEVDDYVRIVVPLESGSCAWVYVLSCC